jgi:hypothetical protein
MKTTIHLLSLVLVMSSAAGCTTDTFDESDPGTITDGVTVQEIGSPGNPFSYVSLRDEQLACFGISVAPDFPSNCRDITDFNDQQMCFGVSSRSQNPCFNITDRNLQLACFGISVAPDFPSNCRDITDSDMRNFCFGVASGGALNNCNAVNDSNTRALCFAMATRNPSTCSFITASEDRRFCEAVATRSQAPCLSIL